MKTLTKLAYAVSALTFSGMAVANDMYIDLGTNSYDVTIPFVRTADADTTTGIFNEFGFSQILATSLYNYSDGSVFGSFFDTNIASELAFNNIPASGTALDGTTPVSLVTPNCTSGQCDFDALSPLVPPLNSDNEGFLTTWDLQVQYHFDGVLTATGPVYTGGFLDVYFNDLSTASLYDTKVLRASLTSSNIEAANLTLFFNITFALDNFLYISNGSSFIDAADVIPSGNYATMRLDTNVDPAIPTPDQLLLVNDDDGNPWAVRQARLDGSDTAAIPEPSVIALMGIGMLGLGLRFRSQKA